MKIGCWWRLVFGVEEDEDRWLGAMALPGDQGGCGTYELWTVWCGRAGVALCRDWRGVEDLVLSLLGLG
jgi:hypothetical protein